MARMIAGWVGGDVEVRRYFGRGIMEEKRCLNLLSVWVLGGLCDFD